MNIHTSAHLKSPTKYFFIFLVLMFLSMTGTINAQSGKSHQLQKLINSTSGEEKVKNLLLLADTLLYQNPDSSLTASFEALKLADSIHNPALAARANNYIGLGQMQKHQNEKASEAFTKSLEYAKKSDDYLLYVKNLVGLAECHYGKLQYDSAKNILETAKLLSLKHKLENTLPAIYNNMGKISTNEGNHLDAIEKYLVAADIYSKKKYFDDLAIVYHNIGLIYVDLKNYPEATHYINLAVEINTKYNLLPALHNNYNSLGNVYSEIDSLEKAQYYYKLVIETARNNNNEYDMAKAYLNLANLLKKQGIYDDAGKYYDSSIYLSEKNNIVFGIIVGKLNLGSYYSAIGKHTEALKVLHEDLQLLSQYNIPEVQTALYGIFSSTFKNAGVYDSALYYYELYNHLNDSIASEETHQTVLSLEKKYQSERKAREIAELQENINHEKSRSRLFIITFVFVAVVLVTAIFLLLARRRAARLREQLTRQENEELKNVMALRNQELVCKALMVSNLNEQLDKINNHVKQIKPSINPDAAQRLDVLVHDLEITLPEQAWHEFETRFEQVHQGFFTRLLTSFPELTPSELKMCSLLRLNMTTKDIALLTNRSIGTVDNIRSSIRRKLHLNGEDNLTAFLLNL